MPFATAQFLITYCRLPEAPSGPDPEGREGFVPERALYALLWDVGDLDSTIRGIPAPSL